MVGTDAGTKHIFRVVEHIQLVDIQKQPHGYFGLQGIENADISLPSPLTVSYLANLAGGDEVEIQNVF